MMTYIHEGPDGLKVEYRRVPAPYPALVLEHRVLRPDGRPYEDGWYHVTDDHLTWLQQDGSDIVALLVGSEVR